MPKSNPDAEYLLRELRAHGLPEEARARIRVNLSAYADLHSHVPGETAPTMSEAFAWFRLHRWTAPVAALLILALMGGSAYAAEGSLPGDTLYAVKVHVSEPLELALAVSVEAKAETHASLAERRLTEAAKLAVRNDFNTETKEYLEAQFSEHVDESLDAAHALEAEGDETAALTARSALEAKLVAHADILNLVEDHLREAGDEASLARKSTRDLLFAVRLRQEVVSESRLALERNYEDRANQTETLAMVTRARTAVSTEARTALLPSVAEHVEEADDALDEARESLDGGGEYNDRRAFRKAWEAQRESDVVSILFKHQDILSSVAATTTASTTVTATTTEPFPSATTTPAAR